MTPIRNVATKLLAMACLTTAMVGAGTATAAEPQGLYSADQLLDADVYTTEPREQVGEIDDVILDNRMTISAFVVETGTVLGLGGKAYVVGTNQVRVETKPGEDVTEPEYTLVLGLSPDELKEQPVYSDSWWNKAQSKAAEAWEKTKEGASSAWTTVKQGTMSVWDSAKDLVNSAAENVAEATGN